jgi:hypothetical protein
MQIGIPGVNRNQMTFHVHRAYEKKRRCLMESGERRKLGKLKNKLKKRTRTYITQCRDQLHHVLHTSSYSPASRARISQMLFTDGFCPRIGDSTSSARVPRSFPAVLSADARVIWTSCERSVARAHQRKFDHAPDYDSKISYNPELRWLFDEKYHPRQEAVSSNSSSRQQSPPPIIQGTLSQSMLLSQSGSHSHGDPWQSVPRSKSQSSRGGQRRRYRDRSQSRGGSFQSQPPVRMRRSDLDPVRRSGGRNHSHRSRSRSLSPCIDKGRSHVRSPRRQIQNIRAQQSPIESSEDETDDNSQADDSYGSQVPATQILREVPPDRSGKRRRGAALQIESDVDLDT